MKEPTVIIVYHNVTTKVIHNYLAGKRGLHCGNGSALLEFQCSYTDETLTALFDSVEGRADDWEKEEIDSQFQNLIAICKTPLQQVETSDMANMFVTIIALKYLLGTSDRLRNTGYIVIDDEIAGKKKPSP